ncbi:SMAD/FHA domain-containing protein [Circinella umbellata]|nr:SMAD/FHA domain-containing protein [Circinella umbellata]
MHVRIVPSIDNPRRSLIFDIIDRELKGGTAVKIGRFTDRSITTNHISFKSKVVSRTHCEIWVDSEDGKLYIRDTKSSSGTFVNHGRLGAANQESKPVEIHNGDIIQLGVDYQGGVEEMYRAVKMRFELNRRPQPLINSSTLAQFVKKEQDHGHVNSSSSAVDECCICLYAMAPFQALFVAPCCHSYHFKCIRPLLESYPGFQCPLCRTYSDLEASVEEFNESVTEDNSSQSHNHHQKREEQNVSAARAGACTTDTTDEDDYVDDVEIAGGQHELGVSSQQRPQPQSQQSTSSSHHQPDPLDTTLVLSPSNLSGILSNPLSPSGNVFFLLLYFLIGKE